MLSVVLRPSLCPCLWLCQSAPATRRPDEACHQSGTWQQSDHCKDAPPLHPQNAPAVKSPSRRQLRTPHPTPPLPSLNQELPARLLRHWQTAHFFFSSLLTDDEFIPPPDDLRVQTWDVRKSLVVVLVVAGACLPAGGTWPSAVKTSCHQTLHSMKVSLQALSMHRSKQKIKLSTALLGYWWYSCWRCL